MKLTMLEIGKIVNTHGVRGELKVQPWCDTPEFLCTFDTLFLDDTEIKPTAMRVHKGNVLMTLPDVTTFEQAEALKNKVLFVRRADAKLEAGRYFNGELMGLTALREDNGETIGKVEDVLVYPASNVLVVRGEKEYLIPAIGEFMRKVDLDANTITLKILEGMATDEN